MDEINLTGYRINNFEVEVSEEFKLLQPNTVLPVFHWLEVIGGDKADFKVSKNKLKLSDVAYSILKEFNLQNAIVEISD